MFELRVSGGEGWGRGIGGEVFLTGQSVGDCGRPGPSYLVRTRQLDVLFSQETGLHTTMAHGCTNLA